MLPPANRGADVNSVLRHVLRSAAFESVAIEPRPNHLEQRRLNRASAHIVAMTRICTRARSNRSTLEGPKFTQR